MTEKELLEQGYKKYKGKELDVYFKLETCNHSGICVRENGDVFDTDERPWIMVDRASKEEVIRVIKDCPSGALKYKEKDSDVIEPDMNDRW